MAFMVPDAVATHFHLRFGDTVADLGAGSGHFARALSRLVGSEGKVYAVDIQRQLAETLVDTARKERLSNIEAIWGDLESIGGTKISDHTLDAALISNTLSMVEDKKVVLAEARRILRLGGKLFLIDWGEASGGLGPAPHMIVSEEAAKALATEAGFVFERAFPSGEHHYGLSFRTS